MNVRKCAHPAGCELLAATGSIYCEGCGTDREFDSYDRHPLDEPSDPFEDADRQDDEFGDRCLDEAVQS